LQEDLIPCGFGGTPALRKNLGTLVFPNSTVRVSAGRQPAAKKDVLVETHSIFEINERRRTLLAQSGTITQPINEAAAPPRALRCAGPRLTKISTIGATSPKNPGGSKASNVESRASIFPKPHGAATAPPSRTSPNRSNRSNCSPAKSGKSSKRAPAFNPNPTQAAIFKLPAG
jgi:hypothetical protein